MKTGQAANNENFSLIHHAEKRLVRVARSADKRLSSIKGSESSLNLLIYLPFSLLLAVGQLEQSIKVPDRPSQNAEKCSFPVQRDVYRCNWAASGAINHRPFNKKFQKKQKNNCLSIAGTFWNLIKLSWWKPVGQCELGRFDWIKPENRIRFPLNSMQIHFLIWKSSQVPPGGLDVKFSV